ncbi:MAG TPA: leucine--tRNA ligase [Candidatus Absconditabacterales bacterium]|nr:leucine--tRNA ligase [Candidatus Absconditabacterales bacterium]
MSDKAKKTFYCLNMFPYPSGVGLHVGHASNYIINDIIARFKRMQGYEVINPIGWDSFGLPTENFAIKQGKPAHQVTSENIENFKRQMNKMELSYDREREVTTSNPDYYKRTQRIFTKLFEKGLAYRKQAFVNWCPSCQTVLANDQVIEGKCERCDSEITQKSHLQWFIKITDYADRLIADLDSINRPEETKQAQKNWIGKSEGAEIDFSVSATEKITVFTTRPDTLYGVTALVVAPEIEKYDEFIPTDYREKVLEYRKITASKTTVERLQGEKDKSGVFSGFFVTHPLTNEQVPVWFADYVLGDYGTGAVMFVPAHDQRDRDFAQKNNLSIKIVIEAPENHEGCFTETGKMINSDDFNGLLNTDAKEKIVVHLEKLGKGKKKITYRLRDRSISRQRYRGSPIPIYYDENQTPHAIPADELPVILPLDIENYKPAGKSPLEDHPTFKNYLHKDGKTYLRECDTLDTFICSSFYFLRYLDAKNPNELVSKEKSQAMPVDFYIGGKEHTVGHLLYARFIHKFLYDLEVVSCPEPFQRLFHQGMVLGPDHRKMSKRRGNIVTPDQIIDEYGLDTLRTYEMFMGPLEAEKSRDDNSVKGVHRFLERVKKLPDFFNTSAETDPKLHQTIQTVSQDIDNMKFNTAISKLMILVNHWYQTQTVHKADFEKFLMILSPFAVKITNELRKNLGNTTSIHDQKRPSFDEKLIEEDFFELPVQFNGKTKGSIQTKKGQSQEIIIEIIKNDEKFSKNFISAPKKIIFIQDKIINIII